MNDWLQILRENRCGVLLIALFINLLVHPFLAEGSFGNIFISVIGTILLLSAVYAVAANRRHFRVALVLALVAIAGAWSVQAFAGDTAWIFADLSLVVALFYVTAIMLHYVLRSGSVTADRLLAAVCIYLFFGFIWSRLYHAVEITMPGSYSGVSANPALAVDDLTYFSFVTLTTLGYGDISPKTPQARCFAIVEAVVGVLYLAILISRLAGQFRRRDGKEL